MKVVKMKVGLILESGPEGAEKQVLPKLIAKLGHKYDISFATFDGKPKMIEGCGKAAAQLIADGCRKVLIVWDLYPAWRENGEKGKKSKKCKKPKPCRLKDREDIAASLTAAKVDPGRVPLICIEEELEAWMIADGRALTAVLSTRAHPAPRIKDCKSPDDEQNPKTQLRKLFRKHGHGDYSDRVHAPKIVDMMPDLTKLRRSVSFARFEAVLAGC
jgi:hypothetical protein